LANAVDVVGEWSGEKVRLGEVLDALGGLRRGCGFGATRTSVVNLVVVSPSADAAELAIEAIEGLGARFPGRTLLVVPGPVADGGRVDAAVRLVASTAEGHEVWSEQVALTVSGELSSHMDSLIEPFTLPDLPVVVWYVSDLPGAGDPLLDTADVVLVDTRSLGDVAAFPAVAELVRRRVVVDLSWSRLRPWRELLAGLFDGPDFGGPAGQVTHAAVSGKEGPRHLLAGWLASRLGLPRAAFSLSDARHVAVRLSAPGASFEVVRDEGTRLVRASAWIENGPSHADVLPLPDESLPWSLADALTHLQRDRVWEQALRGALVFAAPAVH